MYAIRLSQDGYAGSINKYENTIKGIAENENLSSYLQRLVIGYTETPCGFADVLDSFNKAKQSIAVGEIYKVEDSYKASYYDGYTKGSPTYTGYLIRYNDMKHIVDDFGNLIDKTTFEPISMLYHWERLNRYCAKELKWIITQGYEKILYLCKQDKYTVFVKMKNRVAEFIVCCNSNNKIVHKKVAVFSLAKDTFNEYWFENSSNVPKTLINRLEKFLDLMLKITCKSHM